MSVKVFQLLNDVLINGVNHVDDFQISFSEGFNKRRGGSCCSSLGSNNVDVFLPFFHSSYIIFQADKVFSRFRSVISQEFTEFLSVALIFVNTELKVLAELLVEFFEVFSVFTDFLEELKTFLSDVLFDDLQNFVVLQIFSRNV